MEWRRAGLCITELAVERRQFLADADDIEVHRVEPLVPRILLGGFHQPAAESLAVHRRIDREQPQVGARSARLDVDAPRETVVRVDYQEPALVEKAAHARGIGAVAIDEEFLHRESEVDERGEALVFSGVGEADDHVPFYGQRSVLRYLSPESLMMVTTVRPGSRRNAAATLAPEENPAKIPSSRASRRAVSIASRSLTTRRPSMSFVRNSGSSGIE